MGLLPGLVRRVDLCVVRVAVPVDPSPRNPDLWDQAVGFVARRFAQSKLDRRSWMLMVWIIGNLKISPPNPTCCSTGDAWLLGACPVNCGPGTLWFPDSSFRGPLPAFGLLPTRVGNRTTRQRGLLVRPRSFATSTFRAVLGARVLWLWVLWLRELWIGVSDRPEGFPEMRWTELRCLERTYFWSVRFAHRRVRRMPTKTNRKVRRRNHRGALR